MAKHRVFIFGASVGGEKYLTRAQNEIEVIGFLDNDKNKQGTELMGYKIYDPIILKDYDLNEFDYIVVSSMYIDSIIEQVKSLNVPMEKMKFPPKTMLKINKKPFETLEMRNKATNLMSNISRILHEQKCYVSFGTLLGIVRENQLLSWDDDIDFSIFPNEVDTTVELILKNIHILSEDFNLKVYKRMYNENKIANISMHCYVNDEDLFHISFACLNDTEGDNEMYTQEVNITPKMYFKEYDEIIFNNTKFKAPKNHISYLEYTYGDWKVPKKNTSFFDNALSYKESEKVSQTILIFDFNDK